MNVDRMWMLRNKKMILAYPRNVVSHGKVNHPQPPSNCWLEHSCDLAVSLRLILDTKLTSNNQPLIYNDAQTIHLRTGRIARPHTFSTRGSLIVVDCMTETALTCRVPSIPTIPYPRQERISQLNYRAKEGKKQRSGIG